MQHKDPLEGKVEEVRIVVSEIRLIDVLPTAPAAENQELTPASEETTSLFNTDSDKVLIKEEQIKNESVVSTDKTTAVHTVANDIKPFTENQLASLYNNQELSLVDAFIAEFTEVQLRSHAIKQQHKLYELLMNYLRVRNHLIVNSHELERLKENCRETQKQLWCLDKASITETGECQDGNPVSAIHEYSIAHFNQQALLSLSRNLSAIKDILYNIQALYCYEAEVLRLQIDHYIQRVCNFCKEFTNLPPDAPVNLMPVQTPSQTIPQLVELRMCITILFTFQRKILKDGKFVTDVRDWLSKLIAVLLRVATWQDHLFLLNHVLRCPGGVMNWARSYIQIPLPPTNVIEVSTSPLNDPYLDHMIATLAVILLPIKDRDKFLEQVCMIMILW